MALRARPGWDHCPRVRSETQCVDRGSETRTTPLEEEVPTAGLLCPSLALQGCPHPVP